MVVFSILFPKNNKYVNKQNEHYRTFVFIMVPYEYMKSLKNDVNNLFSNTYCILKYIGNLITASFIQPMKDVMGEIQMN
jgi:hypothetical protein